METQVKKSLPIILLTAILISVLAGFGSLGFIELFEFTETQYIQLASMTCLIKAQPIISQLSSLCLLAALLLAS